MLARGLAGGMTHTVGILWSLAGPHPSLQMQQDLSSNMQQRGYLTHVADTKKDWNVVVQALQDYAGRRADCIVLEWNSAWREIADLEILKGFPAVVIVTQKAEELGFDEIVHDRCASFREVAEHFVKTGRKNPSIIMTATANREKFAAFIDTLIENELNTSASTLIEVKAQPSIHFEPQIVYDALEAYFPKGRPPFDALMCNSDEAAVAATAWLRSRGLAIPKDVALVGFNNKPITKFLDPPLASIERRDSEVVDQIMDLLFARFENQALEPQTRHVPMKFVCRKSAG